MKKNVGKIDSIIRILLAAAVAVLYFTGIISGTLAIILGAVAVIFVITGFISWCPIYFGLRLSSRK